MTNNKGILTVIAVVLIAILGVMLYNMHEREENAGVVDTITSNINEASEEISDEIDDHTTSAQ